MAGNEIWIAIIKAFILTLNSKQFAAARCKLGGHSVDPVIPNPKVADNLLTVVTLGPGYQSMTYLLNLAQGAGHPHNGHVLCNAVELYVTAGGGR